MCQFQREDSDTQSRAPVVFSNVTRQHIPGVGIGRHLPWTILRQCLTQHSPHGWPERVDSTGRCLDFADPLSPHAGCPARARSAALPSLIMSATSLAIFASIHARPPPCCSETSHFRLDPCADVPPAARRLRAPGARRELSSPRPCSPWPVGAWAAARGRHAAGLFE